jgi:hypothetical protein
MGLLNPVFAGVFSLPGKICNSLAQGFAVTAKKLFIWCKVRENV